MQQSAARKTTDTGFFYFIREPVCLGEITVVGGLHPGLPGRLEKFFSSP
jgi:hypothetical protein